MTNSLHYLSGLFARNQRPSTPESEALIRESGYYLGDEQAVELYEGLYYSSQRGAWVARFVPAEPEKSAMRFSDATYAEVVDFIRFLHESRIRPTESGKALQAFDAHFDNEVSNVTLANPTPSSRPMI